MNKEDPMMSIGIANDLANMRCAVQRLDDNYTAISQRQLLDDIIPVYMGLEALILKIQLQNEKMEREN